MNGEQLFGIKRAVATARMGLNRELGGLSLRQKLAFLYVSKQSKLTRLGGEIYTNTFTPHFPSLAYDRYLRACVSVGTGRAPVPAITNFAVTSQCICKCWHCSFSNRDQYNLLELGELKRAIAEVQDLGTAIVGITGGEPLLRHDLEEIIAAIGPRSMPIMFTTGYRLTRERVRALKQAGLKIPVVSLDHYTAERHDRGRGVPGIFAYAVKAIEMFKEEGFYTAVSFVPTRDLIDDRADLFKCLEFFRSLGVNDMRLTSPILSGNLTARPDAKLSDEHVRTIYEFQHRCTHDKGYPGAFAYDYFESRHLYGCTAGYSYMFIDSQGNVSPCDFTMMSFGNFREKPIGAIWADMSSRFAAPGCSCYASRIAGEVASLGATSWPLQRADSLRILEAVPPYDVTDLPEFFRRMGWRKPAAG